MKRSFPTSALVVFLLAQSSLAVDLTKIDRTIAKEPAYKNKPKYCLLVFGPEAKTKVWLVLDGDVLYVDRNGNGDLTEEGERVEGKKEKIGDQHYLHFKTDAITDGTLTHRNLRLWIYPLTMIAEVNEKAKEGLTKNAQGNWFDFFVEVEIPGWKGSCAGGRVVHSTGSDINGYLQFADKTQEAPIVHFGGPLQLTQIDKEPLRIGRELDLRLGIGTAGLGAGSFGFIGEGEVIPENINPRVTITYPSRPGQEPIKEHYELKQRC